MAGRAQFEAGGFSFPDEKTMEQAKKETEGVRYLKAQIDRNRPEEVLAVYRQMIDQQIFETPVGYTFLYELREYLVTNPAIDNQKIPPIPVPIAKDSQQHSLPLSGNSFSQPEKKKDERQKEKPAPVRQKNTKIVNLDFKKKFQRSLAFNIFLVLLVIGMFAVTATSGNINILNYENALIEKYENWEKQLDEREEKLRERENRLNEQENSTGTSDEETVTMQDGTGIIPLEEGQ